MVCFIVLIIHPFIKIIHQFRFTHCFIIFIHCCIIRTTVIITSLNSFHNQKKFDWMERNQFSKFVCWMMKWNSYQIYWLWVIACAMSSFTSSFNFILFLNQLFPSFPGVKRKRRKWLRNNDEATCRSNKWRRKLIMERAQLTPAANATINFFWNMLSASLTLNSFLLLRVAPEMNGVNCCF